MLTSNLASTRSSSFLKYALGKLELTGITPDNLPEYASELDISKLELSVKEASSFYKLPKKHKDPFDRCIIWQAINRGFTLISKDRTFDDYKEFGLKLV
jgi:PIN domain nuclease of toxin-antitoxin system